MTPDADKLIRQLSLVAYLMAERRAASSRDVKNAVEGYSEMSDEAFARRFYADRAELIALGVPISSHRDDFTGEELYTLPREQYFLPPLHLNDDELAALSTAVYLLEGQFAYAEPLRLALQNLALGRPNPSEDASADVSVHLLGSGYTQAVATRLAKVETAVTKGRTIVFPYRKPASDEVEARTLDPYSVYVQAGQWYVIGRDADRDAIRTFRLSRIRGDVRFATRRERDFRVPPDFDPALEREKAEWQMGPLNDAATIHVAPGAAWFVERAYLRHGEVERNEDRSITFTTPYAHERMLARWMVRLDGQAWPIAPASLVQTIEAGLARVAELHEGDTPAIAPPADTEPEPEDAGVRGDAPVAPERFAVLQALLAELLASCGDRQRATVDAEAIKARFRFDDQALEEHINLLNLVNFGGGCYAVYAEITPDGIDVEKELYGEEFRRPARLSPLEAKALLLALDLVGPLVAAESHTTLDAVRAKVEAAFGRYDVRGAAPRSSPVAEDVLSVLASALRERRVVRMQYLSRSSGEQLEEREVEPHRLRGVLGEWYCDTYDRTRGGERTFRVDRIERAEATGERFERRPGIGDRDGLGGTVGTAEIWFSPEAARFEVERRGGDSLTDGALLATIAYSGHRWLTTEICAYLGDAVLHDPPELRQAVAERARDLATALRAHVHDAPTR